MPGRDGLSVLRLLRERKITTPVMLLTARGEVSERVEGLMLGADDYLAKPFAMDELVARVHALARRTTSQGLTLLKVHDLTMNLVSREVARAGSTIEVHKREFALLEYLMVSSGRVLTPRSDHRGTFGTIISIPAPMWWMYISSDSGAKLMMATR